VIDGCLHDLFPIVIRTAEQLYAQARAYQGKHGFLRGEDSAAITRGVGSRLNNAETAICHSLMIPGFRILGEAAPATQQSR
jgi:hypothetical protein